MFWNRSELKYSRFAPDFLLDQSNDVVSIWKNEGGISLFFESLDTNDQYSVFHINIADPVKKKNFNGYFSFEETEPKLEIICENYLLTANQSTTRAIKSHLDQYTHSLAFNTTKEQTESLIPLINCLHGKHMPSGGALDKITSCFNAVAPQLNIELIERVPSGCAIS